MEINVEPEINVDPEIHNSKVLASKNLALFEDVTMYFASLQRLQY